MSRIKGTMKRGLAATLCGALCLAFFFRGQLGDGFTLLLGDRHDGVIALSILEHWYNVLRGIEAWDRTAYFFPVPATLGYNDGYLLFGLLHAGFRSLGVDPFLSGELVNVATRAIGFAATLALGRRLFGLTFGWALLGAALFTISNNLFIRGSHVQLFSVSFVPALALLGHGVLTALWDGRRRALLGWGAGFCLLFAACLMTGFYMAWYSAFLGGALLLAWLAVAGSTARRRLWVTARAQAWPLAALAAFAVALNLPFLALYLPKAAETGMHPWADVVRNAPEPLDMLNVGQENLLWGWLVRALNDAFRPGFPAWSERMTGLPPLLLALYAASLVWLARGPALPPARLALLRALGLASLVTWLLTIQVGGVTAWSLVYAVCPGRQGAAGGGALPAFPDADRHPAGAGLPRLPPLAAAADGGGCRGATAGTGEFLCPALSRPAAGEWQAGSGAGAARRLPGLLRLGRPDREPLRRGGGRPLQPQYRGDDRRRRPPHPDGERHLHLQPAALARRHPGRPGLSRRRRGLCRGLGGQRPLRPRPAGACAGAGRRSGSRPPHPPLCCDGIRAKRDVEG